MARELKVAVKGDAKQLDKDIKSAADAGGRNMRQFKSAVDASNQSLVAMRGAIGGVRSALLALGGLQVFKQVAQFGLELEKTRNTFVALTGSVDAANKKLAELRNLAKASPGVTQSFANDLFIQFKALGTIADKTINDLIKSIGRLNTVFSIQDLGTFSRNLIQIFQGGFELDQIKEAINALPIFNQILQSAFGTNDNAKLKKLKDAGKLTLQTYLQGFIDAVNNDPRFKNVTESLSGKLQKSLDDTRQRLGELGERVVKELLPSLERLLPNVVALLDAFSKLPTSVQAGALAFVAFGPAIAPAITAIRTLTTAFLGLSVAMQGALGIAGLAAIGIGTAYYGFQDMQRRAQEDFDNRYRPPTNLDGTPIKQIDLSQLQKGQLRDPDGRIRLIPRSGPIGVYNPATGTFDQSAATSTQSTKTLAEQFKSLLGTTGKGKGASAAERKRRQEIRELQRLIEDAAEKRGDIVPSYITDMESLAASVMADRRARLDSQRVRPGQLAGYNASLAGRIAADEARTRELERNTALYSADLFQRQAGRQFGRAGSAIDDAVSRGRLNADQAETMNQQAVREYAQALREVLAAKSQIQGIEPSVLEGLKDEITLYDRLGTAISDTERFMRGFNSATISVGDAWERFGQNVSQALTNTKNLLEGLKQSVISFFNDLLGRSLQNVVGQVLAPIAGLFGGGRSGQGGGGGILGNIFRTPSTVPQSSSSSAIQNLIQAASGGIGAPASVTAAAGFGGASGLPILAANRSIAANPFPQFAGGSGGQGGGGFSLRGLLGSLTSAAPLLGLSIGSALGGQSTAGNILGAAGGGILGLGLAGGGGLLGSIPGVGGLIATVGPLAAAGFIAAPLIAGAILLGRASQRRKDEQASGEYLTQALNAISQLKAGIASDQIDGSQAKQIFETQILGTFRQQISGLKTKSVVESRLKNQVRDLQKVFNDSVMPEISKQQSRILRRETAASNFGRMVPEFASGGYVPGFDRGRDSVLAMMRPGELVLNRAQQSRVMAQAGPGVFDRAGVPRGPIPGPVQAFDSGGYARGVYGEPELNITLDAQVVVSEKTATGIYITGARTDSGRKMTVNNIKAARTNREL